MPDVVRVPLDRSISDMIAEVGPIAGDATSPVGLLRSRAAAVGALLRGDVDPDLRRVPTLDMLIEGRRVRWYGAHPDTAGDVIVYLHGGGWVVGDIDSYDDDVRLLALSTGAAVVSVDYRRAPEHPFPAPLDDCLSVIRQVGAGHRRTLALAGDSAGGHLALAAAAELRGELAIDAVLALYPCVDPDGASRESYVLDGTGGLLTADAMSGYWDMFAPSTRSRRDPRVALLRGDLRGMPTIVLASAGHDPLRDEIRELAVRLAQADGDVIYLQHPSLPHGFQQMVPRSDAASRAVQSVYEAFAAAVGRSASRRSLTPSGAAGS